MNYSNASEFTDEEIKEQLYNLGFKNIPHDKFRQFKKDLEKLIYETSLNTTNSFYSEEQNSSHYKEAEVQNENKSKKVSFPDLSLLPKENDKVEDDDEENINDTSFVSVTTTSSIVDNKVIKRKIIRKTKNSNPTKSDSNENIETLEKNLKDLNLKIQSQIDKEEEEETLNETPKEDDYDSFYSDDEQQIKINDLYPPVNLPVKSFIRSQSSLSLRSYDSNYSTSRQNLKSNPVKKYQEYKKVWNKHKVPGEKRHDDLRWSIREQMLEKHVIVKRQPKSYTPNTYTVPTDKKRQQLRWIVRNALANQVNI